MTDARPFYHRFAWAYELLLPERIEARAAAIAAHFRERGVLPPARVLDAGCGTGRYAEALANRGFKVLGVDRSPDLIAIAREKLHAANGGLEFALCDLTTAEFSDPFDAILCRGVLNDVLEDFERDSIAFRFAELLNPGGVLLLDVRDWSKTATKYNNRSLYKRQVSSPNGDKLLFQSKTDLDAPKHQMRVYETYEFCRAEQKTTDWQSSNFLMRCWSSSELNNRFGTKFNNIEILPDYTNPPTWTDRLIFFGSRVHS